MYRVIDNKGIMFLGLNGPEKLEKNKIIKKTDVEKKIFSKNEIIGLLENNRIIEIKSEKKLRNKSL